MSSKKLAKKVLITTLSASMVLPFGSAVYANTQALPNGTIVTENGVGYLTLMMNGTISMRLTRP